MYILWKNISYAEMNVQESYLLKCYIFGNSLNKKNNTYENNPENLENKCYCIKIRIVIVTFQ